VKGKVKWFHRERGYGFIQKDDGTDIFVHISGVRERKTLTEGQSVQFEIGRNSKGPVAKEVLILE